jgi:hypothetical protein
MRALRRSSREIVMIDEERDGTEMHSVGGALDAGTAGGDNTVATAVEQRGDVQTAPQGAGGRQGERGES